MSAIISRITNLYSRILPTSAEDGLLTQITVESTAPLQAIITSTNTQGVELSLPGSVLNMPAGAVFIGDGLVERVLLWEEENGARLHIEWQAPTEIDIVHEETIPCRLRLNLSRLPVKELFLTRKIILDPGHGPCCPKQFSGPTGLTEDWVVFQIAEILSKMIAAEGAAVGLTRSARNNPPVSERLRKVREGGGQILVSIHTSNIVKVDSSGPRTCYCPGTKGSKRLAECIQQEMARRIPLPDRGIAPTELALLRQAGIPGVLVEVASIANRLEEGSLRDIDFRTKIAKALFCGLRNYLIGQW